VEASQSTTSKIKGCAALDNIWIESMSSKFVDAKCSREKTAFIHSLFEFEHERAAKRSFSKHHSR
jgi:hypothetical protein